MNTVNLINLAKKCGSGECCPDDCHYEDYDNPDNTIKCMEGLIMALAERLENTIAKDWRDKPMANTEKVTNFERIKSMSLEEITKVLGYMAENMEDCTVCPAFEYCMSNDVEDEPSCTDRMEHWLKNEARRK